MLVKKEVREMKNRIIVLKKGIDKKGVVRAGCCFGALIPLRLG